MEFYIKERDLIVFDLDGTILDNPEFYRKVYSGTLNDVVRELRGNKGLKVLERYREEHQGKGELALQPLRIPYAAWAERLIAAPLKLVEPNEELVDLIRQQHDTKKVVYSGSPLKLVRRILRKIGFRSGDFDLVVGWQSPEPVPVKWSCSRKVFRSFLQRFKVRPINGWSVGDCWRTDLKPAMEIGMRGVYITKGKRKAGNFCYSKLEHFLEGERFEGRLFYRATR